MVYGHQIMRGKSPQVAGDEATPRVHIQASRQSRRLTERIPLLNFLNPLFIPQSLLCPLPRFAVWGENSKDLGNAGNPHQGTLQTSNIGSDTLREKSQNVLAKLD